MHRRHDMPFGAALLTSGMARFGLWAPAAREVEVVLSGRRGDATLPLQPYPEGWFFLETDRATPGTLYQYRIDGNGPLLPDPASRHQPQDVHGPSQLVDADGFTWHDTAWKGRPWEEAVIYELHVGSFTPQGTFAAVIDHLPELRDLGITAIELMPVADFPGQRNWGYDGVLPFAPDSRYGPPDELKRLVQSAHALGLMVFLDVVYNHFGPEGNYLHLYAPQFFTERHHTPWGAAINFDGEQRHWVRQFFIHNALYWLEEYHIDGLRLDAVHAIIDDSRPDILQELAATVRAKVQVRDRHYHLILENDRNQAQYLERGADGAPEEYAAQWNDDVHHALHVLLTGETGGYYADYGDDPIGKLARCLAEGFAYQGEASAYRGGAARGEPSRQLPPTAFVSFLENHDQIGNRATGERPTAMADAAAVAAATSILLLAPQVPLLFMGQEWGSRQPFPFFCDFGPELAAAVTEGRRREFARFPEFADPAARERIPDPMAESTFAGAVLDRHNAGAGQGPAWIQLHWELLRARREHVQPHLAHQPVAADAERFGTHGLRVTWRFADGAALTLLTNLGGEEPIAAARPAGLLLHAYPATAGGDGREFALPAWSALWFLQDSHG